MYPYTASSTSIDSALFDDGWRERTGLDYGDLAWVATGERLDETSFRRYRRKGGTVVIHGMQEAWVEEALRHPGVLVAADAMPLYEGGEHPRSAGTHARVLGVYVRERGVLPLMDALARMSWLPARRLEFVAPACRHKGRIRSAPTPTSLSSIPATVIDRAHLRGLAPSRRPAFPTCWSAACWWCGTARWFRRHFPGQPLRSRASGAR